MNAVAPTNCLTLVPIKRVDEAEPTSCPCCGGQTKAIVFVKLPRGDKCRPEGGTPNG